MEKNDTIGDEEESTIANNTISLAQYSQAHPYQYLKQMNSIFSSCNKTVGKDYSSASMIKLPWKKFKTVSIPYCFQESYQIEKRQSSVVKSFEQGEGNEEQQKERKFWKQHKEIMKRYCHDKKQRNTSKMYPGTKTKLSNNFFQQKDMNKTTKTGAKQSFYQSQNGQNTTNSFRKSQPRSFNVCSSIQGSRMNCNKQNNMQKLSHNGKKDKSHIFLKKMISKGSNLEYDHEKLEQEVLFKLKQLSLNPNLSRSKTAQNAVRSAKNKSSKQRLMRRQAMSKTPEVNLCLEDSRVKSGEFLTYNKQQELLERYKKKIRQIDCSISEFNVKKTGQILKEMQLLANADQSYY